VWRLGAADAAKLAGTPPPADFSDPYPTEGPASLMAANLLSESQFASVSFAGQIIHTEVKHDL